jgi:hypothetical protein
MLAAIHFLNKEFQELFGLKLAESDVQVVPMLAPSFSKTITLLLNRVLRASLPILYLIPNKIKNYLVRPSRREKSKSL